ncbi:MAG: hypothetical protein U9R56_08375 [candidate division Zixibacteria bacterium]|nr:hypothetical protein [candidate division Zixibacteria bacterium]
MPDNEPVMSRRRTTAIFLVSFVMLFAEIALIRWLSTEARIFAYVNNLVLLSCFLGIGLGCYFSRRKIFIWITAVALASLVLMIKLPLLLQIQGRELHIFRDVPLLLSAFTDSLVWYEPNSGAVFYLTVLGMISTFIIFFTVLMVFVPLGQLLGRLLDDHKNTVVAYSINVAASVVGIWCFGSFSLIYSPPWVWFSLIVLLLLILSVFHSTHTRLNYVSILILASSVVFMAFFPSDGQDRIRTVWSPYQKLELYPLLYSKPVIDRGYMINVNNVGYMSLLDLSDRFVREHPTVFSLSERRLSQYDIPYQFKKDAERALILGAGAGNDVSGALRNNVTVVDAVEIDPGIHQIGLDYHPEEPYSDPRVNVIVDDARSFLKRSKQKYDVISFGLLDAHAHSSAYNNTRIDHYVYTLESFQDARKRLRDKGVLTVSFEAQRPWIRQRLHDLLRKSFGYPPLVFTYKHGRYGWGGSVFVISNDSAIISDALKKDPKLAQFTSMLRESLISDNSDGHRVKLTVDDWPYLYLEKPGIPNMHLCIMLILLILFVISKRVVLGKGRRLNFHFFFLGAAFLLLEFQNISKTTLLFGSTWMVNSFIITGILILILLANLFVSIYKVRNLKLVYIFLILSCLIVYMLPLNLFNFLGYWEKALTVSVILNLPIFFGGIIFIESFKRVPFKDIAFGSNLLGAAVGGILESVSFVVGINALLLLVIVFYALSLLTYKRSVAIT